MRLLDLSFMASIIREVGETFSALVKGFSVTFRNMFRKTVTENYPYEPVHFSTALPRDSRPAPRRKRP